MSCTGAECIPIHALASTPSIVLRSSEKSSFNAYPRTSHSLYCGTRLPSRTLRHVVESYLSDNLPRRVGLLTSAARPARGYNPIDLTARACCALSSAPSGRKGKRPATTPRSGECGTLHGRLISSATAGMCPHAGLVHPPPILSDLFPCCIAITGSRDNRLSIWNGTGPRNGFSQWRLDSLELWADSVLEASGLSSHEKWHARRPDPWRRVDLAESKHSRTTSVHGCALYMETSE